MLKKHTPFRNTLSSDIAAIPQISILRDLCLPEAVHLSSGLIRFFKILFLFEKCLSELPEFFISAYLLTLGFK